jgi:hypothetical protein
VGSFGEFLIDKFLKALEEYPPALAVLDLPYFNMHYYYEQCTHDLYLSYMKLQNAYISAATHEYPELAETWFLNKFKTYHQYSDAIDKV